jgi:hypothetical protein
LDNQVVVRHDTLKSFATEEPGAWAQSQPHRSSKEVVCLAPWRAQGTDAVVTPCSLQVTLGTCDSR